MLNSKKAYSYFNNRFGLKKSTNGWWAFDCPFCFQRRAKKAACNFNYEVVKCWKCELRMSMTDFVMEYEGITVYMEAKAFINSYDETELDIETIANSSIVEISEVKMPCGFTPILEGEGSLGDRARCYLSNRGFNLERLDRKGFGYCVEEAEDYKEDYFGRIIIPFKRNGKLAYYIGRDFIGSSLRYKNPSTEQFGVGKADVLYNEDALYLYDTCCIMEGWSDAETMGRSSVATMGWSLSAYQRGAINRGDCKKLVFIPDMGVDGSGESFYRHAVRTAMSFLDTKEEVYVLNMQEAGLDTYGKDVNEVGRKRVLKVMEETEPLTFGLATKILLQ